MKSEKGQKTLIKRKGKGKEDRKINREVSSFTPLPAGVLTRQSETEVSGSDILFGGWCQTLDRSECCSHHS